MNSQEQTLSNISFVNKDFESLWTELLALVPKLTRKWVPSEANESDPLSVLLKLNAISLDKGNYNIDKEILELFPLSLTQQGSAFQVYDSAGFTPNWYRSAEGAVRLTFLGYTTDDGTKIDNLNIPRFTEITNSENTSIYTIISNSVDITSSGSDVSVIEGSITDFDINGIENITSDNLDVNNRLYFIESNVAQNGIFVQTVDDEWLADSDWKRVTNLEQQQKGTKCFKFGVDNARNSCYIEFPSDIGSLIGSGLKIKYILSSGSLGNVLRGDLVQFYNNPTTSEADGSIPYNDAVGVFNTQAITTGKDPDTLDEIYKAYKRQVNVVDTLVTLLDYKNYLKSYRDSNSKSVISNVQVSDRTNDMISSYKVVTLDPTHAEGTIIEQDPDNAMTAFDLRFYPLRPSTDVSTKSNYDATFENFFSTGDEDTTYQNALEDVKAINHNYATTGEPIVLSYDLSGQIYLESKVTAQEASKIRNNVLTALWENTNAYKVEFGEAPDYGTLVDTIKNSDKRIQYVALDPINTYKLYSDTQIDESTVTKRSVLSGVTPWVTADSSSGYENLFELSLGQGSAQTLTLSGAPLEGSTDNYLKAHPFKGVEEVFSGVALLLPKDKKQTILRVAPNEQLSLLTPQYVADVTYSNYLWYTYTDITGTSTPLSIQEGELVQLNNPNISIRFYEEKGSTNPVYEIKGLTENGPVIQANFLLEPTTDKAYLSQKTSISLMKLVSENFIRSGDAPVYQFYCSSPRVYDNIAIQSARYTLQPGEYVIFASTTDTIVNFFTIYQEGTTVELSVRLSKEQYKQIPAINLANIQQTGDLGNILQYFVDVPKQSSMSFSANTVLTFGENTELRITPDPEKPLDWRTVLGTDRDELDYRHFPSSTGFVTISKQYADRIRYYLPTDLSDPHKLPSILESSVWMLTINMPSLITNKISQKYLKVDYTDDVVGHQQALMVGRRIPSTPLQIIDQFVSTSVGYPIPSGAYRMNASPSIAVQTGRVQLASTESIDLLYSEGDPLESYSGKFSVVPDSGVVIPGTDSLGVYFILPYIDPTLDTVKYLLCKPGKTIPIDDKPLSSSTQITNPTAISSDSVLYAGTTVTQILGDANYIEVPSEYLYNDKFNPTHIPSREQQILDPLNYATYFNKNHIYNAFTIAKIENTDNLQISSLSIKS